MNDALKFAAAILIVLLGSGLITAYVWIAYVALTQPLRRAERTRLFLELLQTAIEQGRPIEETIISLSNSRDLSVGIRFHLLAACLEEGMSFSEAIKRARPSALPQVNQILLAGLKIGNLSRVLPACRQLLNDSLSHTRAAINYVIILTFVITPFSIFVAKVIQVLVLPKIFEASEQYANSGSHLETLASSIQPLIAVQIALLLALWIGVIFYLGGSELRKKIPFIDTVHWWLPWRRKRLHRDFSTLLSVLLDAGISEPEAVIMAADCTMNRVLRRRAAQALRDLNQGRSLSDAVAQMDDSGEFQWRLKNALHRRGGFLQALAGWHESLDAKAFQQEQAAAQIITTGLVIWTGVFVGVIVISIFGFLVSVTEGASLW